MQSTDNQGPAASNQPDPTKTSPAWVPLLWIVIPLVVGLAVAILTN